MIRDKIKEWTKKKPLSSVEAYTLTKYGISMDENRLLNKYIETIDDNIIGKANKNLFNLVLDIDPKFPDVIDKLIKIYSDRGYIVMIISSKIDERIVDPKIFISWN